MAKNKNREIKESKKDMNNENSSLVISLQQKFPEKSEQEVNAAIDIAGPGQKEIEEYLTNPVNGEGFTPAH
jgi:hypothetical protein